MRKAIGFILFAGLLGGSLVGCGGGANNIGTGARLPLTGNIFPAMGNTTNAVPAGGTATFNVAGTTLNALAPFGIPANSSFGVFRDSSVLLAASYPNGNANLQVFQDSIGNSRESGASLGIDYSANGSLIGNIALPPGQYTFEVFEPSITGNSSNLTIGTARFTGVVLQNGATSFPNNIAGVIPGEGEVTRGTSVNLTFDSDSVNGMLATLTVIHEGGNIVKHSTVVNKRATFVDVQEPDQVIHNPSLISISVVPNTGN